MFDATEFAARLAERKDRWSLLKDFVAEWHAPLQDGDGYSVKELDAAEHRLGLTLPMALREWYQLAGKRKDIVATQNYLVKPKELEIEDGLLVFHSENQGVVEWGIRLSDLELLDPPIYLNDSEMHTTEQEPIRENDTLSEFALQMVNCETIITRKPLRASYRTDENIASKVEKVEREFVRLGFPGWHWPNYPVCFYGTEGTIALTIEGKSIYLATNNQSALAKAKQLLEIA